jgi:flagellar protein FliS
MNASTASRAYGKTSIESGVLGGDPHKLIAMLYQGALLAIANAKNAILRKDIAAKGAAISKAMAIVDEGLNASLDKKAGGELAENLSSLYDYMGRRLLSANLTNNMDALDEVARLLNDLKGAWESIRPVASTPSDAAAPMTAKVSPIYTAPVVSNPAPAKAAQVQPQAKVAAVQPQAKPAPAVAAAPIAQPATQPKVAVATTATATAKTPDAPQQQRVVNKLQMTYGRM